MVRTYQEVFDDLYILDVPGTSNRILLALPRKQTIDRAQLVEAARKTAAQKRFDFDLGDIAEDQFRHSTPKTKSGRVLRDADTAQPSRVAPG
jgi:hypothetical protein